MTSLTMPLDCAAFEARLADYLEGDLPPALRAAADAHRAACPACAALVADLDAIRDEAARLPELRPSRDLWEGIAARIEAPVVPIAAVERRRAAGPSWLHRPWVAAAAALVLVASTAAVTYTVTAGRMGGAGASGPAPVAAAPAATPTAALDTTGAAAPAGTTPPAAPVVAAAPSATADASATAIERPAPQGAARGAGRLAANGPAPAGASIYDQEIAELRSLLNQRRAGLDTTTVRVLEQNLAIIDQAIRESRAALSRDPASPFLNRQLTDVLGEKLELMRTAVLLSGADD